MMYTHKNGEWQFHRDEDIVKSHAVAIIFEQDEPFDVLLKHGSADKIESLFISDKYSKLCRSGCRLVMVVVPPCCCETLNKCLSISASKWCSKLMEEANSQLHTSLV